MRSHGRTPSLAGSNEYFMHDVDISRNHGHGTVPVPGRESHTADLKEFDRYVSIMEHADRLEQDLQWDNDVDGEGDVDGDEDDASSAGEVNETAFKAAATIAGAPMKKYPTQQKKPQDVQLV